MGWVGLSKVDATLDTQHHLHFNLCANTTKHLPANQIFKKKFGKCGQVSNCEDEWTIGCFYLSLCNFPSPFMESIVTLCWRICRPALQYATSMFLEVVTGSKVYHILSRASISATESQILRDDSAGESV